MKDVPAFPQPEYVEFSKSESQEGMSLRDYFAAKALQALITNEGAAEKWDNQVFSERNKKAYDADAERAYKYADAMLKQRER